MLRDVSIQSVGTGTLAAVVGYGSSVAIVIQGLKGVGADEAQIACALAVLCLAMGLTGVVLSAAMRMPISVAWSTPGMALLASSTTVPGGFHAAAGAFIAVGAMIMLAGLWSPIGRLIAAIPKPIASGMLAGIILKMCLAPFAALSLAPLLALLIIAVWVAVGRFFRLWAAPAALAVAVGAIAMNSGGLPFGQLPAITPVVPVFDWQAMASIALPLFIVTMASQNIPGLAVLATHGFRPKTRPVFLVTGAVSALSALLGAPTINLAAITAALCAGPDANPDPSRRWVAGAVSGIVYMAFALLAGIATVLVTRASPILIEAVAGLALIGAFGTSILAAVQDETDRVPALMTFLVTASGLTVLGVGAAFWGLVAGLAVHLIYARRSRAAAAQPALASGPAAAEGVPPSSSGLSA
jgi:benzoate membrane transport protein